MLVHYFEDGNVQMNNDKEFSTTLDAVSVNLFYF